MSATFILDCSVTMPWCFEDEDAPYAEQVQDRLNETAALAPAIWWLEVANVLLSAERRRRITTAKSIHFLDFLKNLPITIDPHAPPPDRILSLGRQTGLTAYDATYLELAMRHGLPLATLDAQLIAAAKALGVEIF